jgi:GNAT superfamily N-acetyltransferase
MEKPFSDLSKLEIESAIENNLIEAWSLMVSLPWIDSCRGPEILRYISGVPHPLCNGILGANISGPDIDTRIEGALVPFKTRNLPMFWYVGPSSQPSFLGGLLLEHGLTLAESVPGMAADLAQLKAPPLISTEWAVRRVESRETLEQWIAIFSLVYQLPKVAADFFFKVMDQIGYAPGLPFRHYLGTLKGEPVACSSLFSGAGAAGLYNVAAIPEVRGKGLGTAISAHALKEGHFMGCQTGILHSTAMGLPVYQRLGFKEHCCLRIYLLS